MIFLGIATAEELVRQREKLEKTDKQLDEINATLRFSQKHINGIKSVFSSLKNYMSGKNNETPTSSSGSSVAKVSLFSFVKIHTFVMLRTEFFHFEKALKIVLC